MRGSLELCGLAYGTICEYSLASGARADTPETSTLVFQLLAALALVGILVFIHESGHFIFAKIFGVGVQVFSLGFGRRLFGVEWLSFCIFVCFPANNRSILSIHIGVVSYTRRRPHHQILVNTHQQLLQTSCAPERVFSILNDSFGDDQQSAYADYNVQSYFSDAPVQQSRPSAWRVRSRPVCEQIV